VESVYSLSTMAKLADISLPDAAPTKARSTIETVVVSGDVVTRFNEARDQIDQATEVVNELRPSLIEAGLDAVFQHNCEHAADPKAIISSVNLTDEETKEVCQFTWTRKNLKNNAKQVDAEFKRVRTVDGKKADINGYAGYEVVASFDTGVFMVEGSFSRERYDAFMAALNAVSAQFEVPNPLTCGKVLKPKADFHAKRWQDFDFATNLQLQTVLPTQVSLEPIRPEGE
jgi:hypothetical protein